MMPASGHPLADDARAIFAAAVDAVRSRPLVANAVRFADDALVIGDRPIALAADSRVVVVGGGKAGRGMVRGLLDRLAPIAERVTGLVSVPGDCVPDRWDGPVAIRAGRPAGDNSPHPEGVDGTRRMLQLVAEAGPEDVVVVLLSGGGSALLTAPHGCTLDQKRTLTRQLADAGATIAQLNAVRRQLSDVKAGGLLRSRGPGPVAVLAISDVIGDDWGTIASGPTTPAADPAAAAASAVAVLDTLAVDCPDDLRTTIATPRRPIILSDAVSHHLIGSNAVAVAAAARVARDLGYEVVRAESGRAGEANAIGRELIGELQSLRRRGRPVAVIDGGEPVVSFATAPGRGGRNQQLVLAAIAATGDWDGLALLSGGTDGEDGPTDAAGAVADAAIATSARERDIARAVRDSDAYPLLHEVGGLLRTGPTDTNVMDVRVGLVGSPRP